ncbi:peptide deformylase, partial [Clostridium sporogenes]
MAIRNIRKYGDELLRKKSRKVEKIDDRILTLLEDMAETMYSAEGVGLAAPQVGILKRVVVIDVGEGLIKLINPEIIETEGSQKDVEGCL